MLNVTTIAEVRGLVRERRAAAQLIGLVPTMGNLHDGHLELVRAARKRCGFVITSIFVNPMQFGPTEDLLAYPRTLADDKRLLESAQCDCLFHPGAEEIYPGGLGAQTVVRVPELDKDFCGSSRPGHFEGVATVVSKLFNIIQPDSAFFGLKDYQQFLIISKMVRDLEFPIEIVGVETRREPSGLAMSSRNNYLSAAERTTAAALYWSLQDTAQRLRDGDRDIRTLCMTAERKLASEGFRPDYYAVCDAKTLKPADQDARNLVILAAAYLGKTRLIDNLRLTLA